VFASASIAVIAATTPASAGPEQRLQTLHMSPRGSDAGSCTRQAPCRTFDRAYRIARPGQVVELAGGVYPAGQVIRPDPRKTSSRDVVFRAARGATAAVARTEKFASLDVMGASHLTFRGLHMRGDFGITPSEDGRTYAKDVTILGGKLTTIHLRSAMNVTFRGVEIGNFSYRDGASSSWFSNYPGDPPSRNILVDRVRWHNIRTEGSPTHPECLIVDAVDGITIRNSRFIACPVMALFFSGDNGRVARNVLVENNVITCGGGRWKEGCGATINFRPDFPFENVTIRFNSISGLLYLQPGRYSDFRVYGNVISNADCHAGTQYSYNVISRRACSSTDRRAAPGWVNESRADLRLRPGAGAVNLVPPSACGAGRCPRRDITGRLRRGRPDAGAHELR
jgi:hypothetical protein